MDVTRNGKRPSNKGPADYFTGQVRVDPLFSAHDPARTSGAYVTFDGKIRYAHQPDSMLGQGNQGFYRAFSSTPLTTRVRSWVKCVTHRGPPGLVGS
jgi:hypothetical protein